MAGFERGASASVVFADIFEILKVCIFSNIITIILANCLCSHYLFLFICLFICNFVMCFGAT